MSVADLEGGQPAPLTTTDPVAKTEALEGLSDRELLLELHRRLEILEANAGYATVALDWIVTNLRPLLERWGGLLKSGPIGAIARRRN